MLGLTSPRKFAEQCAPMTDYGFFGPDSVTWKVWSHPTSYVLGFVRAVTIEHLDPNLAAAVVQSGGVKYRPNTRYDRTLRYFAMVAFGGAESTARAADVLVKVHSKAIGHDPVTGGTYDANDGDSQLWIHMTAWHSILLCYEKFGPGQLSEIEEKQFWAECREAAKLQTIDPDKVPASRAEVRAFFEEWRPRLAASEAAQDMINFILPFMITLPPKMPAWQRAALRPFAALMSRGVISTYPRYMRELANLRQGRLMDALVLYPNKALHKLLERSITLRLNIAQAVAPAAVEILTPAVLRIPPQVDRLWEVREAQEHFGLAIPSEAHPDVRAKQRDRVLNQRIKPSDEGLIESEQHIGAMSRHTSLSA